MGTEVLVEGLGCWLGDWDTGWGTGMLVERLEAGRCGFGAGRLVEGHCPVDQPEYHH